MFKGFRNFLFRGNVIDLAVAVIIGAAFTKIVDALVKDILAPFISALGGKPDFSSFTFTINNNAFLLGDFLNALLAFIIVAAVVYFAIVYPMNKIMARLNPKVSHEKPCPECLSLIPIQAKRCKYCTTHLATEKER